MLVQEALLASTNSTPAATTQAASLTHQQPSTPTTTPSRTPVVFTPSVLPVQTTMNPTTPVQNNQAANVALSLGATPLRVLSTTPSGAADSATADALRLLPLETGFSSPVGNPLAITNPIPTPSPKLTPFPPSGGAGESQPEEQVKPPAERETNTQEQAQDLLDLAGAGLSAAFVPDSTDEASEALALVGVFDSPSAFSELQLVLLGVIAASSIGVAHRRNRTKESERELLEAASWLPRPLLK
jgi:hypothetical protein